MSHRYGSRPTPATIYASLFERLQQIIDSDPTMNVEAELLSQWYKKDTNCVPASYILQPISSILPNIKSKVGANEYSMEMKTKDKTTCFRMSMK